MASTSSTTAGTLRISPEDLKARLQAGTPVTILDVRNPKAWESSNVKIRGARRVEAEKFRVDPSWPKNQLTVVY